MLPQTLLNGSMKWTFLTGIILTSLLSTIPYAIAEGNARSIENAEGENPTPGSGVEKNLDIQFMIEPSSDPLDPLFGEKWSHLEPGNSVDFWVIIANIGPENDTYEIELKEPLIDSGWDWYIKETGERSMEVNLTSVHQRDLYGGVSFTTMIVHVSSPIDARKDSDLEVRITAESKVHSDGGDPEKYSDSDEIHIILGHGDGIDLSPNHPTLFYSRPGEWLSVPLSLTNLGNKDVLTVEVFVEMNNFWITSIRKYENLYKRYEPFLEFNWTYLKVDILQGRSVQKDLSFRLPYEWTGEDDVYQFRYIGRVVGAPSYMMYSDVITVIGEKYSSLSLEGNHTDPIKISPGEKLEYNLTVNNSGWSEDILEDIYLLDNEGVDFRALNETGKDLYRMEIPERSSRNIGLEFEVPLDTPPGSMDLQVIIDPFHSDPITVNLTLVVREKMGLELIVPGTISGGTLNTGPGEEIGVTFGIFNSGNTPRECHLDILKILYSGETLAASSLDRGWSAKPEWVSQSSEPWYFQPLSTGEGAIDTSHFDNHKGYLYRSGTDFSRPIAIEPRETVWIRYIISSPDGKGSDIVPPYRMGAFLQDGGTEFPDPFEFNVEVLYPDLNFHGDVNLYDEDGSPINETEKGSRIRFSVNITNSGSWISKATFLVIQSKRRDFFRTPVDSLCPGEMIRIEGNFSADETTTGYKIELDPDNMVIESDDQFMEGSFEDANIGYSRIEVRDDDDSSSYLFPYLVLILILISLILAALVIYFSRRYD